ncbi:MAG: CHAT domain-containing protein [Saprospiraceae bacterium]|nr:CHAT domain-containing protein [Saprospiraceae bacterium]
MIGYRFLGSLLIFLISYFANAQSSALNLDRIEQNWRLDSANGNVPGIYENALHIWNYQIDSISASYLQRSINVFTQLHVDNDTLIGRCHVLLGLALRDIDVQRSIQSLTRGLVYYKRFYPPTHIRVHSVYFNLADKYYFVQDLIKAQLYCDTAVALQISQPKTYNWPRVLNLRSRIFGYTGDMKRSLLYNTCARPYLEKYSPDDRDFYIITRAGIYRDLNLAEKALESLRLIPPSSDLVFYKYSQMAQAFIARGEIDSAIIYLDKQLEVDNLTASEENWIYANKASAYEKIGRYELALSSYKNVNLSDGDGVDSIVHLSHLSQIRSKTGQLSESIRMDRKLLPHFLTNDRIKPFEIATFLANFLEKLVLSYQMTNDTVMLAEAVRISQKANERLQLLRQNSPSVVSRQHFAANMKSFYDSAIKICNKYHELNSSPELVTQALELIEATKALVLVEEFTLQRAENNQRLKYRTKYEELENRMNRQEDLEAQIALSDSIFFWLQKESQEAFTEDAEYTALVPDFSNFKTQDDVLYLSYFQHQDTSLSIIGIGDEISFFRHLGRENWYERMLQILAIIRDFSEDKSTDSAEMGSTLLPYLIPMSLSEVPGRLVIVPDGLVAYFPFEVLCREDGKFLFEDVDISYSFSLAMLDQISKYPSLKGQPLLLAPFFDANFLVADDLTPGRNIKFGPLEFNRLEASQIFNILKRGHLFLNEQASPENFYNYCETSPIIHIATHAIASHESEQKTQIVFSEEGKPILLSDIYNSKIPANMVVMSACQTAVGRYSAGEGVMSFARAFTAAGCKSVIASLWAVNDQSTAEIMISYYRYVRKGKDKDQALRQAKLDYIGNSDPIGRHPYFWAGFVAIGDMEPLYANPLHYWILAVLFLTVVLAFFYLRWRITRPDPMRNNSQKPLRL